MTTFRPHRFPQPTPDFEVWGWECAACGVWVDEFHPEMAGVCSVDWRADLKGDQETSR